MIVPDIYYLGNSLVNKNLAKDAEKIFVPRDGDSANADNGQGSTIDTGDIVGNAVSPTIELHDLTLIVTSMHTELKSLQRDVKEVKQENAVLQRQVTDIK